MKIEGQVTPFNFSTSDGETLFCWHVLPLDVYLDNEIEVVQKATGLVDDRCTGERLVVQGSKDGSSGSTFKVA